MSYSTVKEVYVALRKATEGSRDLDIAIAELLGWERTDAFITDISTGAARAAPQWIPPGGDAPSKVPLYTTNLDAAYNLAWDNAGGRSISVSWEDGNATAAIGGAQRYSSAPTPALALCIATLVSIAQADAADVKSVK